MLLGRNAGGKSGCERVINRGRHFKYLLLILAITLEGFCSENGGNKSLLIHSLEQPPSDMDMANF